MRYFFHINFIVIIYMSDLDYSSRDVERRPVLWTILLTSELKQRGGLGVFFNSLNLCLFSESGNRRSRDVLLCPG